MRSHTCSLLCSSASCVRVNLRCTALDCVLTDTQELQHRDSKLQQLDPQASGLSELQPVCNTRRAVDIYCTSRGPCNGHPERSGRNVQTWCIQILHTYGKQPRNGVCRDCSHIKMIGYRPKQACFPVGWIRKVQREIRKCFDRLRGEHDGTIAAAWVRLYPADEIAMWWGLDFDE